VACALVRRGGRWLWARRGRDGLLGGLWELPSAEVPEGAGAAKALERRLAELGVPARVGARLAAVDRLLTHRRLRLEAYACRPRGTVRTGEGVRWEKPGEPGMGISTATRRLAEAISSGLAGGRTSTKKATPRAAAGGHRTSALRFFP